MSSVVVLLAAGKSSRTTTMKQLYKVDGEYLINLQIKKILSYGYNVAVVLGHNYENIVSILEKDVKVVYNANYKEGMFSSVKEAFRELSEEVLLFCHIDRPIADRDVFESLLKCESEVAVAYLYQRRAPPIMIKSTKKDALLSSQHSRLDHWVVSNTDLSLVEVTDEKVHFNANTDEELRRYFA